jgi:hypothetical protein
MITKGKLKKLNIFICLSDCGLKGNILNSDTGIQKFFSITFVDMYKYSGWVALGYFFPTVITESPNELQISLSNSRKRKTNLLNKRICPVGIIL